MTLKLHHLRPAPGAKTAKTRVGRGEGSKGKTAGRGTKGTKARNQVPASFEGGQMPIHMRLPKLKGFKNPFKVEFQVVNLDRLGELFPEGGEVTVEDLVAKGAVRKGQPVKVLGQGDLSVAVQVSAQRVLRLRQGEDRGRRRHRHRPLTMRQGRAPLEHGSSGSRPFPHSGAPLTPLLGFDRAEVKHPGGPPRRRHRPPFAPRKRISCYGAFVNAFRTPDLRRKLLFVLFIVTVFRLGSQIPTPGVNVGNVQACLNGVENNGLYTLINLFSGGALLQLTIFALGIMPYITASIILQLLVVVIPRLEALKKEGQSGQTKITQYTRYLTLGLAVLQATGIVALARSGGLIQGCDQNLLYSNKIGTFLIMVVTMTAGTAVIMWLGELITERGVGNGMSLMIFTQVISGFPSSMWAVQKRPGLVDLRRWSSSSA